MPQVPQTFFDALAVRTWCGARAGRAGPGARGDRRDQRLPGRRRGHRHQPLSDRWNRRRRPSRRPSPVTTAGTGRRRRDPTLADAVRAMAHGALIGARGNSGTILAQLLRGMAQVLAAGDGESAHTDGRACALALRHAADAARQAVAHPVEGTVLTVASAAADAAAGGPRATAGRWPGPRTRARAAALAATPGQLAVLGRAGVVDAGGRGLVAVLGGAGGDVHGRGAGRRRRGRGGRPRPRPARSDGGRGAPARPRPDDCADAGRTARLRGDLPPGGRGRGRRAAAGAARRARRLPGRGRRRRAVERPRPRGRRGRRRGGGRRGRAAVPDPHHPLRRRRRAHRRAGRPPRERAQRAVVAVVPGEGLAGLYTEAGATTVLARPGEPPAERRAGRGRTAGPRARGRAAAQRRRPAPHRGRGRRTGPRRGHPGRR